MGIAEQFAGKFLSIEAHAVREHDVLLFAARPVIGVKAAARSGCVAITTVMGVETIPASATVRVFRPGTDADDGCAGCDAEPGEPCDPVTCLGLALMNDAAEQIFI